MQIPLERAAAYAVLPHLGPDLGTTERWLSGLTGGALLVGALARRSRWAAPLLLVGGYGIYRGVVGRCPITRSLAMGRGLGTRREPIETSTSITVAADPDVLFDRWRDVGRWPEWMRFVADAEREDGRIHYVIRTPDDLGQRAIEMSGPFTEHPSERALHFVTDEDAALFFSSTVRFVLAPDLVSTEIHVEAAYAIPGGKLTAGMSSLLGGSPDQQIRSDVRRFKQWVETGEITTTLGQPSGRRRGPITKLARVREKIELGATRALREPGVEEIEVTEMPVIEEVRP